MVYDTNLVTNISDINKIVSVIRRGNACKIPGNSKRREVSELVKHMNISVCERILNEAFNPKWIP